MPWDCETFFGYAGEIIFHVTFGQGDILFNSMITGLFVSICLHHEAFYEMFEHSLRKLDVIGNRQEARIVLCKLIDFHNTIRRYCTSYKIEINKKSYKLTSLMR